MVRRTLSAAVLGGLAAAGAASAGLLGAPGSTPAGSTTGACGTTTAATVTQLSTAVPTTVGSTLRTTTAVASTTVGSTTVASTTGGTTTAAPPTTSTPSATTPTSSETTAPTTTAATTTVSSAPCGATTTAATTEPATTTSTTPALVSSNSASTLVFDGHGFGHGIGMSQWGADGYARHGWSADQILRHYYPGTTIGLDPSPTLRVLLSSGTRTVRVGSAAAWHVRDADGATLGLPAGELAIGSSLEVDGRRFVSPLTVEPGSRPVELGGHAYRGSLVLVVEKRTLDVVDHVGMESYLDGVVGAEMPPSWPAAALEAQAIAARSFAMALLRTVVPGSPFDFFDDSRTQVYGGIAAETASVRQAVQATAHEVVLFHGSVATTYYSSSSGGETVSAAEADGTAVPYLRSESDPYDVLSPYHDWGPILVGAAVAGKELGLAGPLVGLEIKRGPSHHVESAIALGSSGSLTLSGEAAAADLGLPSSWFSVGWLALTPPSAPVVFGSNLELAGIARGVSRVTLEVQTAGSSWQEVAQVDPGQDGAFSLTLRPRLSTRYRLASGAIRAATIEVPVAAAVSVSSTSPEVRGSVEPANAAVTVVLQRQTTSGWAKVASSTTDAAGAFAIAADLAPATYRVQCDAADGLAAGDSLPFIT